MKPDVDLESPPFEVGSKCHRMPIWRYLEANLPTSQSDITFLIKVMCC